MPYGKGTYGSKVGRPKKKIAEKKKQKGWEPAFPGADHSKEELKKMTKAQKEAYYN